MIGISELKRLAAGTAMAALLATAPAMAATIDFDALSTAAGDPIANGYAGLEWDNFFGLAPLTEAPRSGYQNAITSGRNVAFNGSGDPATIGGLAGMVLLGGNFTAAFNDGLTVTVRGFDADILVHETSFLVDTRAAKRRDFGWSGITRVVFSSAGGTDQFFDMSGTNFAVDDLDVAAVPEPATWLTMILGFSIIGAVMRKRRRTTATVSA